MEVIIRGLILSYLYFGRVDRAKLVLSIKLFFFGTEDYSKLGLFISAFYSFSLCVCVWDLENNSSFRVYVEKFLIEALTISNFVI